MCYHVSFLLHSHRTMRACLGDVVLVVDHMLRKVLHEDATDVAQVQLSLAAFPLVRHDQWIGWPVIAAPFTVLRVRHAVVVRD